MLHFNSSESTQSSTPTSATNSKRRTKVASSLRPTSNLSHSLAPIGSKGFARKDLSSTICQVRVE